MPQQTMLCENSQKALQFAHTWFNPAMPLDVRIMYVVSSQDSEDNWACLQAWDPTHQAKFLRPFFSKVVAKTLDLTEFLSGMVLVQEHEDSMAAVQDLFHPVIKAWLESTMHDNKTKQAGTSQTHTQASQKQSPVRRL